MAITLSIPPGVISWSKNFSKIVLNYTGLASGNRIEVEFYDALTAESFVTVSYPCNAVAGAINISDVDKLLDPHCEWSLPTSTLSSNKLEVLESQRMNVRSYKIRARSVANNVPGAWNHFPNTYRVIKGGIGQMGFEDPNFNLFNFGVPTTWLPEGNRFLTWVPDEREGRTMCPDEWGWLLYLSNNASTSQYVEYDIQYLDGSSATINNRQLQNNGGSFQYRTWWVPMGVQQANLDPTNKGVYSYSISVKQSGARQAYHKVWVDNRPYRKKMTLYYRNSMGGLDHILLRGVTMLGGANAEKKEYMQQRQVAVLNGEGQTPFYDSSATIKFKANTGHISRSHKASLFDLFNTTYAAILVNNIFVPMRVPAQEFKQMNVDGGLEDFQIEFETANKFTSLPYQLMQLVG